MLSSTTPRLKRKFTEIEPFIEVGKTNRYDHLAKARGIKKLKKECLKKSYPQGFKFSQDDKKNILHIYHTLKTNKTFSDLINIDTHHLTSLLYGCSKTTVVKIVENDGVYDDRRKNRFQKAKEIPAKYREVFQNQIRKGLNKGMRLTCTFFREILFKDQILVSIDTIGRKLREWGLKWGSLSEKDFRRKNQSVLDLRRKYLKQLMDYERKGWINRVYLDESFINKNHSSYNKGWYIESEGKEIYKPMGKGPRVAIMGAIDKNGWVGIKKQHIQKSLSVQRPTKIHSYKSIRYWNVQKEKDKEEENINQSVFQDYFENSLLPNLPQKSVIILDNARYHKKYPQDTLVPTTASNKQKLIEYLSSQGEESSQDMQKKDLLKFAKNIFNERQKTEIQEMAEEHGHVVLYLPPYHPELNPIEFAWGYIKGKAALNPSFEIKTIMKETLPAAFASLSQSTVSNFFDHIKKQENIYLNIIREEEENMSEENHSDHSSETAGSFYDDDYSESTDPTDISYVSEDESDEEDI